MSDTITQANRLLAIATPAGEDVLLLDSITGEEGISKPFRFVLNLMAHIPEGNPDKVVPHNLVGQRMTVSVDLSSASEGTSIGTRFLTGLCDRFVKIGNDTEFAYYTAVIVPWFYFLTYSTNCRIFQGKSVTDIITAVVTAQGFSANLRNETTKTYSPRDYCVQYRETDFAFLSRLMESEGIYYYFEHSDSGHTMVLGDAPSCYKSCPTVSSFHYSPETGTLPTEDTIFAWQSEEKIHAGKWKSRDHHHESPTNTVERGDSSASVATPASNFELYDYPAEVAKKFNEVGSFSNVLPEAEKISRIRMEREETFEQTVGGSSRCRAFIPGYKVDVVGGYAAGSYLLTSVSLTCNQQPAYRMIDANRPAYQNTFEGIPATVPFVPPAVTNRALVPGLQTAIVISGSPSGDGEEIWPDKYGRIRALFPWDRDAQYSCWLRVIQPWAGKSWGQQWLPRIGDEVAVSFLEGDPDLPVVVGSVYNANNMPIFALPDNKTQSGVLTRSTPNGGSSNFNMVRFEDKIGQEEIYTQAEKDYTMLIKHDETRTVKNDRTSTIHVNDSRTVETGDDKIDVQQGNRTIKVQQNISETSTAGDISTEAKAGNVSTTAMQNISTTSKTGNISTEAQTGEISVKALSNISESSTTGNISVQATLGNITVQAAVGSISISGLSGVTISCGASSISMTPASISISAPMVMING